MNAGLTRLADPAFFLTPEFTTLMGALRAHAPVQWCQAWPGRGFWAVTRHADMKAVLEQPVLFSSEAAGNIIPADPDFHRHDRLEQGFGVMPTNTDPPRHGELRRMFSRYFTGPQIAKHTELCQATVDGILGELGGRDRFDFVMEVAAHLPARLICRLLGVPPADWPMITQYANSFASFADPTLQLGASPAETFRIAMTALFTYVSALVEKRRGAPENDLASVAAHATLGAAPMPHIEAAWGCFSLLAAGFETSRNVIAGGLLALLEHPAAMARLRQEPKLMQPAVDEMIRWTMPATALLRVASTDATIGTQPIAAGDWVVGFIESANRDESVFADPFRFDITRKPNPYLSFGHGIHNCIGRMLAMLEVRVMTQTMLDRCTGIELDGPLSFCASTISKGVKHMPIKVTWRAAGRG